MSIEMTYVLFKGMHFSQLLFFARECFSLVHPIKNCSCQQLCINNHLEALINYSLSYNNKNYLTGYDVSDMVV